MAATILLITLIAALCLFIVYALVKRIRFTQTNNLLFICINLAVILLLFIFTGTDKIKSSVATIIHRSAPKPAPEVYSLLFKKPIDSCVHFIHFKDQLIPRIDCCIWMELKLCTAELNRISALKKYTVTKLSSADSAIFLKPFTERPDWWAPQTLGESIVKLHVKFNSDNEQIIFFGKDSSHIFICDQAL